MKKPEHFEQVLQHIMFAADDAAMSPASTPAQRTRAIVRAALTSGIVNGLISINEVEKWRPWIAIEEMFDEDKNSGSVRPPHVVNDEERAIRKAEARDEARIYGTDRDY